MDWSVPKGGKNPFLFIWVQGERLKDFLSSLWKMRECVQKWYKLIRKTPKYMQGRIVLLKEKSNQLPKPKGTPDYFYSLYPKKLNPYIHKRTTWIIMNILMKWQLIINLYLVCFGLVGWLVWFCLVSLPCKLSFPFCNGMGKGACPLLFLFCFLVWFFSFWWFFFPPIGFERILGAGGFFGQLWGFEGFWVFVGFLVCLLVLWGFFLQK